MAISPSLKRPQVNSEQDAVALTNAVLDALEDLEPVIEQETALLQNGDTSAALALAPEKTEKAGAYVLAIETLKANIIAVQRFRPDAVSLIRERHDMFGVVLAQNMQVLTTARAVSEGIIREVSSEVAKAANPAGYGPDRRPSAKNAGRTRGAPLAVSKDA
jgi:hypothetical protein